MILKLREELEGVVNGIFQDFESIPLHVPIKINVLPTLEVELLCSGISHQLPLHGWCVCVGIRTFVPLRLCHISTTCS